MRPNDIVRLPRDGAEADMKFNGALAVVLEDKAPDGRFMAWARPAGWSFDWPIDDRATVVLRRGEFCDLLYSWSVGFDPLFRLLGQLTRWSDVERSTLVECRADVRKTVRAWDADQLRSFQWEAVALLAAFDIIDELLTAMGRP